MRAVTGYRSFNWNPSRILESRGICKLPDDPNASKGYILQGCKSPRQASFWKRKMKVYRGKREGDRMNVTVDGRPLAGLYPDNPRRNLPFDWGKLSPGAFHLAETLLVDCTGSPGARNMGRDFASAVVSELPDEWQKTSEDILKWYSNRCEIGYSCQQAIWDPLGNLRKRVGPEELARHGFPRPSEVRLSQSADSTGEEAYYVYLVFPDRTPEKALAWNKIEPMVSWVRNLIWTETGERLWPYVKVKRQKEMAGDLV